MQYGFVKVAAAVPSVRVADCAYNIARIESLMVSAEGRGIEILVLPEALCYRLYLSGFIPTATSAWRGRAVLVEVDGVQPQSVLDDPCRRADTI